MYKVLSIKQNEEVVLPILWTGEETNINHEVFLNGKGASVTVLMLLLGKKTDRLLTNINVYHQKPETKSRVIVKGIIGDDANVDFNGLVKIEKKSKGSNAWLAAHLLLLSKNAKGRAVPSLEILENDVKAGHATTVGRVNDLEIFYLMSRGLSKANAKSLIIQGFLSRFLDEFPQGTVKTKAMKQLRISQ